MGTRIAVGLTALVVVLGVTWVGGFAFLAIALFAALAGGHEFYMMLKKGGYPVQASIGLIWLALLVLCGWQTIWPRLIDAVLIFGFIAVLIYALYVKEEPLKFVLATVFPALYLGTVMGQAVVLRNIDGGFWWVLLAFMVAWGADTFAYFVGVTLGKHKIWPRLSPKKTWEGTIAGWLGGMLLSVLVVYFSPLTAPVWAAALIGFVGGILAFFGDLSISMIKRQTGVKDSGYFFPGHGGMLDRLDSMLFVFPFIFQATVFLAWVNTF